MSGNIELVEPMQTGLLFTSDDDAALAGAMAQLTGDRELRRRLGALGRQQVRERFSVQAMVHSMQGFYYRSVWHHFWQRTHAGGR